ncbi:30S ribosomal protein S4 [Candidatus Woesearchaeota archaeon]|nr:30S ribosomal protein S4 [Candidatus Woesearchaeota archaeon]
MGDPRRVRKKFQTPSHPWQKERIEKEHTLTKEYGLKNKRELWKMASIARSFTTQAKRLSVLNTPQARKEEKQVLTRLQHYGWIKPNATLDDVLGLTVNSILERRLQTLVFKKNLAKSIDQARQFIVHRHILVGKRKITVPSYLVPLAEETAITFAENSKLQNPEHPERKVMEKASASVGSAEEKKQSEAPA